MSSFDEVLKNAKTFKQIFNDDVVCQNCVIDSDEEDMKIPCKDTCENVPEWILKVEVEKLQTTLQEILDADKQNYEVAKAIPQDTRDKAELLAYSWGRIQLAKTLLGCCVEAEKNPLKSGALRTSKKASPKTE